MLPRMATTRRAVEMTYDTLAWAAALLLLGGVLCFVPLFDALGYEWCLAVGVAAAFAGAQLGAAATVRWRRLVPTSDGRRRGSADAGAALRTHRRRCLADAAAAACGHRRQRAARPQLRPAAGFGWFALLPLPSAAMGVALGMVVALARPWRSLWAPSLAAIGGIFVSARGGSCVITRRRPSSPTTRSSGICAGPIYDEDLRIGGALVWARLYHAVLALTALATCCPVSRRADAIACARAQRAAARRCWRSSWRSLRSPSDCTRAAPGSASISTPATWRVRSAPRSGRRTSSCTIRHAAPTPRASTNSRSTASCAGTSTRAVSARAGAARARVSVRFASAEARARRRQRHHGHQGLAP